MIPPPYPGVEMRLSFPPAIGEAILAIQQRLAELGLPCADIRGAAVPRTAHGRPAADIASLFGGRTSAAVWRFQTQRNLKKDGIVGSITWGALWDAPPAQQPVAAPGRAAPAGHVGPVALTPVSPNARDTDLGRLHPEARRRVHAMMDELAAQNVPMKVFEAYRTPERQRALFAQGRNDSGFVVDKTKVVTKAPPFESYHQYGLAVDVVIDKPGVGMWETGTAEARGWWAAFHAAAIRQGLEPLSWEMPHVQVTGLSESRLLRGLYPPGGDAAWAANLAANIVRWPGSHKPPPPAVDQDSDTRPPIAAMPIGPHAPELGQLDWDALPRVAETQPGNPFGGLRWRVDGHGVHLDGEDKPQRTEGAPQTAGAILELFGTSIHRASARHGVPAELIVMTIATEVGAKRKDGFTGPTTFRWEDGLTDYSAGPMQVVSGTAREVNRRERLGHDPADFPAMSNEPASPPSDLALYDPAVAIDVGAALIKEIIANHGTDPILVAAAYNAGSLRGGPGNRWRIHCTGTHLDRAAEWFGDACEVLGHLRH